MGTAIDNSTDSKDLFLEDTVDNILFQGKVRQLVHKTRKIADRVNIVAPTSSAYSARPTILTPAVSLQV